MLDREDYLQELRKRRKKSRVYTKHQLIGLMIADILDDKEHISLYIKLAKKGNKDFLLGTARDVADRDNVDNKGAYFMRILQESNQL